MQSGPVAEAGIDEIDNGPVTGHDAADFDQGDHLQELGRIVPIFHVEVFRIFEGGENRIFLLLFERGPLGRLGADDAEGAGFGAGAVFLVEDGDELEG